MTKKLTPMEKIDKLLSESIENDDPNIVLSEIGKLHQGRDIIGKVLAKVIGLLEQSWSHFSLSEHQSFEQTLILNLGMKPGTVARYRKWWAYHPEMPEKFQDKPIRYTIPITNAIAQGYHIDDDQYDKLDKAGTNLSEIQRVVTKEVKGKQRKIRSLQIYIDKSGSVYCWYNDERWKVGFLDVECNEEAVKKSIERIITNTGIMKR